VKSARAIALHMGKHISVVIFYLSLFIPNSAEEGSSSRIQGDSPQDPVHGAYSSIICTTGSFLAFLFVLLFQFISFLPYGPHCIIQGRSRRAEACTNNGRWIKRLYIINHSLAARLWFPLHSYSGHEKNPLRKVYLDLSFSQGVYDKLGVRGEGVASWVSARCGNTGG